MIGLISTPPGPYPQEAPVPPAQMTHIRDEINRLTRSQRMLAHGLFYPGIGNLLFQAIAASDYFVIYGVVFITVLAITFGTLLIDLVYPLLDPRIVYHRA